MEPELSTQTVRSYLFNDLHARQGKSWLAARYADAWLPSDTTELFEHFGSMGEGEVLGDFARIAAVCGLAGFKRASHSNWEKAGEMLVFALNVQANFYPYANTPDEARKRGDAWVGVYGKANSTLECLRDTLHALSVVEKLSNHDRIKEVKKNVVSLLKQGAKSEMASCIYAVEEAPFDESKTAYDAFLQHYQAEEVPHYPEEIIAVSARMIGRSVDEIFSGNVKDGVKSLKQAARMVRDTASTKPGLRGYALGEVAKNASAKYKEYALARNMRRLRKSAMGDTAFQEQVDTWLAVSFVGLGYGKIARL